MITILVTGATPAFAGPVIIDGTDSPDHGFRTGDTPRGNWPYIQNAIESLLADETRAGPHTVDILSIGTKGTSGFQSGSGGGAINSAADLLGVTVQHCGDPTSAQTCFDGIVSGDFNPRVLYFAGTGSGDDVGTNGVGSTLTSNAQTISDFVASGGGVLSHGSGDTALGWLGAILPGLEYPSGCTASGAALTPNGEALFPKITNENIRGICHNHFTGNFGGLVVLALDGSGRVFILGLEGGVGGSIEEGSGGGSNGGMNHWDTRPSFGVDHETRDIQQVDSGFTWGDRAWTIDDNHHTDFTLGTIETGLEQTFSATVFASKGLKVQEFAWGIPVVGEAQNAETRVEVYYDNNQAIEDIKVVQDSIVIDPETISVSHQKVPCLATDQDAKCDRTTVGVTFLSQLKYEVAGIHAIDHAFRDQWTYLNDGFEITGDSLIPMETKMIPSNVKNQGLMQVTQVAKYSPYWTSEDGRMFEMNSFGSFKQVNQTFERFQDAGNAFTRQHSSFGGILDYEKNRATQVFDSTALISELPDSFGHHFEMKDRLNEELMQEILLQQEIAQAVLDEMDKLDRNY